MYQKQADSCSNCGCTDDAEISVEQKTIKFIGITYNSPKFHCPRCGKQKSASWLA